MFPCYRCLIKHLCRTWIYKFEFHVTIVSLNIKERLLLIIFDFLYLKSYVKLKITQVYVEVIMFRLHKFNVYLKGGDVMRADYRQA